jgi:hypothetical protein
MGPERRRADLADDAEYTRNRVGRRRSLTV